MFVWVGMEILSKNEKKLGKIGWNMRKNWENDWETSSSSMTLRPFKTIKNEEPGINWFSTEWFIVVSRMLTPVCLGNILKVFK